MWSKRFKTVVVRSFVPELTGWGNGYVLIPKGHSYYGKIIQVRVHGGVTFHGIVTKELIERFSLDLNDEGKWVIGFDTGHFGDRKAFKTKESVEKETLNFLRQISPF